MKKIYLLGFLAMVLGPAAFANPGDTTVIRTSPVLNADNSTNYDSMLVLPDNKTYRKIFLVYTIGSHACPAGSQYCHQWDYLGQVNIKSPHGDTLELARVISPFATSGWSRFPQPPNWHQDYVFDITDFAPYLKDTATINSALGVGSPGFEINTKLIFIEGTPDRNTIGIAKAYSGGSGNPYNNHIYGKASDPINDHFSVINLTAPTGTVSASYRMIVTGHGSDANQCCEFGNHYYNLLLNGTQIKQRHIWREDCGLNQVYPQGGTWVYDRSNWCPGSSVIAYYDTLPGITAGSTYNLQLAFENYVVNNPSGVYDANAQVVYYGGFNKTLDASLDDIISPSNNEDHFRKNPANNAPTITIHNSGSTALSSVSLLYGVQDSTLQSYTWNGSLAPLADTTITLPVSTTISNMASTSASGTYHFVAIITGANGQADNDATNDTMRSSFVVAPNWPGEFVVKFHTGNIGRDGNIGSSPTQGSWVITDADGNAVAGEPNAAANTDNLDTVRITTPGFYQLKVLNNAKAAVGFCFGLHWWALEQSGLKSGALWVKDMTGANIPMHGYTYANPANLEDHGEHDDFGCEYTQYFYVSNVATEGISGINTLPYSIDVYPNPARTEINIHVTRQLRADAHIELVNVLGQTVYTTTTHSQDIIIPTKGIENGIYALTYNTGNSRKIKKVVIAK